MCTSYKFEMAFTLAEVLITLAIIGVVAAIVIPTAVSKINRLQVETALPVAYRNIEQIIKAAEMEEGPMEEWHLLTREEANKDDFVETFVGRYICPYVAGSKCGKATLEDFGYKDGIKYPKNDNYAIKNTTERTMMRLPNGMTVVFGGGKGQWGFKDSTKEDGYDWVDTPSSGITMHVDINGPKKPNVIAKDVFSFQIYLEEIHTLSMVGHLNMWAKEGNKSSEALRNSLENNNYGWGIHDQENLEKMCSELAGGAAQCGAIIMRNNWKIPKNYPWL